MTDARVGPRHAAVEDGDDRPGVTARPRRADHRRLGARWAFGLIAVSMALGLVHAGAIVNYAYPVVAVAIAFFLLNRDRYLDYIEFAVWLWLIDPGVRRITDFGSVYHSQSPVIITAELVSLVGLYRVAGWTGTAYRETRTAICVVTVVLGFGAVVGVVHGRLAGSAVDVLFYGGPLAFGVFVLLAPIGRRAILQRLSDIAVPALLILGLYGIEQFIYPPAWDVNWVISSNLTANGSPVPFGLRVFSLSDSPGPFGQTTTILLLLAIQPLARGGWWRRIAIGIGLVALGLSLVRAAWIALALGVIILILAGRLAFGRLAAAIVAVGLLVAVFGGPVRDAIQNRFTNSVQAGGNDTSFQARVAFQARIAPKALQDISGQGLGAAGVGTKLSSGDSEGATSDLVHSFDSGIFEIIFVFGALPGIAFLVVVIGLAIRLLRRHLRRGPPEAAFAAAALIGLVSALIFTNTIRNLYGADYWLLAGTLGAPFRRSELTDEA